MHIMTDFVQIEKFIIAEQAKQRKMSSTLATAN